MTVVLTPALVEKRLEARRVFPGCTWPPGDECPIGVRATYDGRVGEIRGVYAGNEPALHGWWYFWDDKLRRGFGPNAGAMTLQYPPTLEPFDSKVARGCV